MFAAIQAAKAKGAFEDIIEEDGGTSSRFGDSSLSIDNDSEIDDPFMAHTPKAPTKTIAPSPSKAPNASSSSSSSATQAKLSSIVANARDGVISDDSSADDYSADEFSMDDKPSSKTSSSNNTNSNSKSNPSPSSKSSKSSEMNALASLFASKTKIEDKKEASKSKARSRSQSSSRSRSRSRSASPKPRSSPSKANNKHGRSRDRSRSRSRSSSRSRSRSNSRHRRRSRSASRSRSRSRSRSASPVSRPIGGGGGGGMSKLKALLTKKRDDGSNGKHKSFMDVQHEKLSSNPHYVKKQKELALKKFAAAGFMSSAKTVDYSKQVSGLLSDIKNCSFKPKLSLGTRDLLEKGGHLPEFSERLKGYIQTKKDKLEQASRSNAKQFSFQPNLNHDSDDDDNDKDAEAKRKEFDERVSADLKRRSETLASKQRLLDPACTFTPNLSKRPKSAKLEKSFTKRYYEDLEKRDNGLETKIAAARCPTFPFAPQITTNVRVKGSFLERTVKDVELRNKKMRYRAKLLDLEPPAHGRISIPAHEDDPFYLNEQRKQQQHSHGSNSDRSDSVLSQSVSPIRGRASLSLMTSGLISSFGGNKGISMSKAIARPEVKRDSHKIPPKRGQRLSTSKKKEYERALQKRHAEERARAKRKSLPGEDDEGRRGSSATSSRRSSIAPEPKKRPATAGPSRNYKKSISRSSSRSRSRSHSSSRSRSRSRSSTPPRRHSSRPASHQGRSQGRPRHRSSSRSRSPSSSRSRSPPSRSDSDGSLFGDKHDKRKGRR